MAFPSGSMRDSSSSVMYARITSGESISALARLIGVALRALTSGFRVQNRVTQALEGLGWSGSPRVTRR